METITSRGRRGIKVEGCNFEYYERPSSFESMYGKLNLKGRIILDIGADWGSTPHFFISQGAKQVIAVEGNDGYYKRMKENFRDDPRVTPIFRYIREPRDIGKLIEEHKPDIVKIDCEGCERHLPMVQKYILKIPSEYIIETHLPHDILASILVALCDIGFVCKSSTKGFYRSTGVQHFIRYTT